MVTSEREGKHARTHTHAQKRAERERDAGGSKGERGEDGDEDGVPIYRWAAAMLIKHPFICNPLSDERSLFHVQTGLVVFDQQRLPALAARSGSRAVLSLG